MRTFLLVILGLILLVVVAGAGYVSYRLYLFLPDKYARSQVEYPQAAVDLLKLKFDSFPVSPPDSYNMYSFFLASQLVGKPPFDKDMIKSMLKSVIDNSTPDQGGLNTPDLNLWMLDFLLVEFWLRFFWEDREILRAYLGAHRYGGYEWKGLEEASRGFFGVSAKDLTLPEMAVLVVNFKAPFALDPLCYKDNVREDVVQLLVRYKKTFPDAQFDADQMFVRLQPRKCYREQN